mmetsp:Transcript_58551/g.137866  ORF Transcript_58551/g.137866 Transcript_58551/m.137866 type:complete len:397 (+) Transcript_58551:1-1191(+)
MECIAAPGSTPLETPAQHRQHVAEHPQEECSVSGGSGGLATCICCGTGDGSEVAGGTDAGFEQGQVQRPGPSSRVACASCGNDVTSSEPVIVMDGLHFHQSEQCMPVKGVCLSCRQPVTVSQPRIRFSVNITTGPRTLYVHENGWCNAECASCGKYVGSQPRIVLADKVYHRNGRCDSDSACLQDPADQAEASDWQLGGTRSGGGVIVSVGAGAGASDQGEACKGGPADEEGMAATVGDAGSPQAQTEQRRETDLAEELHRPVRKEEHIAEEETLHTHTQVKRRKVENDTISEVTPQQDSGALDRETVGKGMECIAAPGPGSAPRTKFESRLCILWKRCHIFGACNRHGRSSLSSERTVHACEGRLSVLPATCHRIAAADKVFSEHHHWASHVVRP